MPPALRRDGELLACLMGVSCLAFGFELTNPTLGIDDYSHLSIPFQWTPYWVSRGMWGGLFVHQLLPGGWITPFISLIIGLSIQCLTAILLGWLLPLDRLSHGQRFLAYSLFTTFPFFAAQMAFSYLQIGYPLSSCLCIAVLLLAQAQSRVRWVLGALLTGFALSIYQGCISVLLTAGALLPVRAYVLAQASDDAPRFNPQIAVFARTVCIVLAGAAGYYLAHKAILAYTGIPLGEGHYAVRFDLAFWQRWDIIVHEIGYLFMGSQGLVPHLAQLLFLLVLGFVVLRLALSHPRVKSLAILLVVISALLLAPFGVLFLHEGELAPRSALGMGVLWLAVWALAQELSPGRLARRVFSASGLAVLLLFMFQNNRMFYSEYLVEQADMLTINRIAERISMLDANDAEQKVRGIVVLGTFSYPKTPATVRYCDSVLGYSMFEWDTQTPYYAAATLAKIRGIEQHPSFGIEVFNPRRDAGALVAGRAPWPHADAVFLQDGYAVVWLGERRTDCGEGSFTAWLSGWLPAAAPERMLEGTPQTH